MRELYVGIMSGTSLDGVDVVLADLSDRVRPAILAVASAPFAAELRDALLALQGAGDDELHRAALAANDLVDFQATLVAEACRRATVDARDVRAIGAHGQTVRHRPELGYTLQLNAPARLAERTGIAVVSDFRSRDVAAGGQGAPLVPAFHDALYRRPGIHRVVVNVGGMSNVTDLPADPAAPVRGWDCGPGNVLLDGWIARHRDALFDAGGVWAASGRPDAALLAAMLDDPWFALPPPKSTGRERFDVAWLEARLAEVPTVAPVDVQATLVALTATTIADAIGRHAGMPDEVIVCGGGAYNTALIDALAAQLARGGVRVAVTTSANAVPSAGRAGAGGGIAPEHVEALAFAWLAQRCLDGRPGNLPEVTGAAGPRILGAITPR